MKKKPVKDKSAPPQNSSIIPFRAVLKASEDSFNININDKFEGKILTVTSVRIYPKGITSTKFNDMSDLILLNSDETNLKTQGTSAQMLNYLVPSGTGIWINDINFIPIQTFLSITAGSALTGQVKTLALRLKLITLNDLGQTVKFDWPKPCAISGFITAVKPIEDD